MLHPILASLQGTEHAWISELLFAFNAGDIGRFESLLPQLAKELILEASVAFLRQKICLMALIEHVFRRPAEDRTLSFATVAAETRIPVDEVEHLMMKALSCVCRGRANSHSLNLVRGSIDEVAQMVRISWVQPRVLDAAQTAALLERLTNWCDRVNQVAQFVQKQSPELFTEV